MVPRRSIHRKSPGIHRRRPHKDHRTVKDQEHGKDQEVFNPRQVRLIKRRHKILKASYQCARYVVMMHEDDPKDRGQK